jgi:ribonucleoside-diphosphate reductase alpha chain
MRRTGCRLTLPCFCLQLAARIAVSNLHKSTTKSFVERWVVIRLCKLEIALLPWPLLTQQPPCARSIKTMYNHINPKNGEPAPLVAEDVYKVIMEVRCLNSAHRM